jgi:26S proteasome regulatory subunit N12
VQGRTAEFHCSLELLSAEALASAAVSHCVQLEQCLMEGAYNKVLSAAQALPDASFGWFSQRLEATVREEVAACAEAAYNTLPLPAACALLKLDAAAGAAFCAQRGWRLTAAGNEYDFRSAQLKGEAAIPAGALIANTLAYARELERII